jgi:hypothetical protein
VTVYVPGSTGARKVQVTFVVGSAFFSTSAFAWTKMKLKFFFSFTRLSSHQVCSLPSAPVTLGFPTTYQPSLAIGRA